MSAAWATALREATYFEMGHNPGLGGRLFRTQFACWHLVRTTRRLQKHRVIPSVAVSDARRRPVTQSGASCALKHSSALFLSCPFLKILRPDCSVRGLRAPGHRGDKNANVTACRRVCRAMSPDAGRGLIPKIIRNQRREKRKWSHSFGAYEDERRPTVFEFKNRESRLRNINSIGIARDGPAR